MMPIFNTSRSIARYIPNLRLCFSVQPFQGISTATKRTLETAYDRLSGSSSQSLLRKHFNELIYEKLWNVETPKYKSNILDCIQSGFSHYDSVIGVYAPDADAYKSFADLFDPIIEEYHGFKKTDMQLPQDYGNPRLLKDIDPLGNFILSTRMRIARNIEGYPFTPRMTKAEFSEMEEIVQAAFLRFTGELKGTFYPLDDMFNSVKNKLIEDHMLRLPNRFMKAGNICRYTPIGRAIYYTNDKKFSIWLNYEDHLRIISMQQGADFREIYFRLIDAANFIDNIFPTIRDDRLGYVTVCPSNLGTSLRVSVLVRLVKLPTDWERFQKLIDKHQLQVRGTYGEFTPVIKGIYELSNKNMMGVCEYDSVRAVYDGVLEIIREEKCAKLYKNTE